MPSMIYFINYITKIVLHKKPGVEWCTTNLLVNSIKSSGKYKNLPLGIRGIEGVTAIFPHNFIIVTPLAPLNPRGGTWETTDY